MQVKDPILYFFLLVFSISLNLSPDVSHKQGGFSKTLPKEAFEFDSNRRNGIVAFNLRFVLLLAEVNPISEKQGCKKDTFIVCGSGYVKIILTLLTEIIALHMQVFIVKIGIPDLDRAIARCGTCLKLPMFLTLD